MVERISQRVLLQTDYPFTMRLSKETASHLQAVTTERSMRTMQVFFVWALRKDRLAARGRREVDSGEFLHAWNLNSSFYRED